MLSLRHAIRPLLLLLLVLMILFSATWMVLRQKPHNDLKIAHADARKNVHVAAAFLANALQDGRYQDNERLLREWGEANRDLLYLKLVAANGFELASYRSPTVANYSHSLQTVIPYSYQGKATLTLTTDLTPVYRSHQRLVTELIAIFALFAGMLAVLVLKIVQRRQAQAQLQQLNQDLELRVAERTAELAEKNRELETFTYSVSHDLKAPLRGIDGYSRLLLAEHSQHLNADGRFFVQTIRNATEQMGQLIDDLLAYSRLERRSMALGAWRCRSARHHRSPAG